MLELRDIEFEVDGVKILRDINLKVENEFLAITGQNGGGKSTLAKIIAGIEKPTRGQIFLNGIDINAKSITERAKLGISFAFQQPVKFKGLEVIDLLKIAAGGKLKFNDACNYLSAVGLCARDYINREINSSLSGGELKRIEIATILARQSEIAIFDEPEAGIDLWSFKHLIKIFENLRKNISRSLIIISHQERILRLADEIIVLKGGQIISRGDSKSLLPKIINDENIQKECGKINV